MATLAEICTEVIESIGTFAVPTTIIGNDDDVASILRACARQVGRELVRDWSWQAMLTPYSFATVASTSLYSLPTDFQRFANDTFYNVSEYSALYGPLTPSPWSDITRGLATTTVNYNFRVRGDYLELTPTPSDVQTIGFDYYSSYYCESSGGTAQGDWAADTDVPRLPLDLFIMGIRYRFLQRKELPFAEDKADYLNACMQFAFDDTPKRISNVSGFPSRPTTNLPESNF